MCVHAIPKALTFGKEGQWQTCEEFRNAVKQDLMLHSSSPEYTPHQSDIDEVVASLHRLGHVIMCV
jgi:hypothetical protein